MRHDAQVINRIKEVQSFPSLLKFLRDDLDWPITSNDVEDLTFDYSPDELGFDKKMAVKVRSIKQLRPLVKDQPWGIFYIDFEPKRLPVGALRRLLRSLVVKKRGGGDGSQATWNLDDLLFISFHGEESRRTVAFAHFHEREKKQPQLRTFYWDQGETEFASVLESLGQLNWPQYASSAEMAHVWRQYWGAAFRVGHGEVIRDSKALSKKLAQVALKIRQHVFDLLDAEDADKGPLHRLFASFKKALLHDLDEQRFADVLAQTFTYGLLAAKAEIGTKTPLEPGHLAEQIPATNPLLRELFEEFQHLTGVGLDKLDEDLGDLGVDELVDLLNTVDVDEALKNFGRTTMSGQEDPVVHFYEEFLKDYDKEQKVERGVFYTPKPVVSFIVRSVHEILQKEFGLEDGLASTATWDDMVAKHKDFSKPEGIRGDEPFVQVLDPAVGTGTFLEACIQLMYDTMAVKWTRAGKDVKAEWNRYVPEHLLPRLHGFELMMAPYVVCHMKLGLRLKDLGYDFQSGERLRVYLTNALEPGVERQSAITGLVAAVAHEAHDAAADKREKRFTVVLGNPPYSGLSGNMADWAQALVEAYKEVDGQPLGEKKVWLQDDYVKFIRRAQVWILEATTGVLGFISNHGYVNNPTFRGMRKSLIDTFDSLALVDLHGNANKKERSPDGSEDKNVFDIRQGVAILLGTSHNGTSSGCRHADVWGSRDHKYNVLTGSSTYTLGATTCQPCSPYYFLSPLSMDLLEEYQLGWSIPEIMPLNAAGFVTARDHFVVDLSERALTERIERFADLTTPDDSIRTTYFGGKGSSKYPNGDSRGWKLPEARLRVNLDPNRMRHIRQCLYRPFDVRFIYWADWMVDWPRPQVMPHQLSPESLALLVSKVTEIGRFEHVFCSKLPAGHHSSTLKEVNYVFPLVLAEESLQGNLMDHSAGRSYNISSGFNSALLAALETAEEPESLNSGLAHDVFSYIYAILHSPTYRTRYEEYLRSDFPRIPLPGSSGVFQALATLGGRLCGFHTLAAPALDSYQARFVGQPEVVLAAPVFNNGVISVDELRQAKFERVPERVWTFTIGGYQVAEKWLKDRKGRVLTDHDIRHYEQMLYAIEETIRIMAEIDEVIEAHGGWPGAFQGGGDG